MGPGTTCAWQRIGAGSSTDGARLARYRAAPGRDGLHHRPRARSIVANSREAGFPTLQRLALSWKQNVGAPAGVVSRHVGSRPAPGSWPDAQERQWYDVTWLTRRLNERRRNATLTPPMRRVAERCAGGHVAGCLRGSSARHEAQTASQRLRATIVPINPLRQYSASRRIRPCPPG